MLALAVIGDVHGAWDQADVDSFDAADSPYDALLFVGDFGTWGRLSAVPVAAAIAPLQRPAYAILGNHDGTTLAQLAREVTGLPGVDALSRPGHAARVAKVEAALGARLTVAGYSAHTLAAGGLTVGLIAARPHAMGVALSFAPLIAARYGVDSLAASAERLCALVDACPHERLIFLAHNGPTGLGTRPTDPWGCDFRRGGGDWGDPDLRAAIDHARAAGRRVDAVVAGHMHLRTKQKQDRTWHREVDGVHYVNAACVPRWLRRAGRPVRHHVALTLTAAGCEVREVYVPEPG